jgi:hypothetical protein
MVKTWVRTTSERMANSNSPTMHIHFVGWNAERLDAVQSLTGESLVDLVKVDILFRESDLLEHLWDSVQRAHTHDARWYANDSGGDKLAEDR